jgi:hypothetical protein
VWVEGLYIAPDGSTVAVARDAGDVDGLVVADRLREGDLLLTQRLMKLALAEILDRVRAAGVAVVADVDDHFWRLDRRNAAYAATDPRRRPDENRDTYARLLAHHDRVVVSTPFLADELRRLLHLRDVVVVENTIDLDLYPDPRLDRHVLDAPRLGWAGSTSHRSGDLEMLVGVGLDRLDPTLHFCHLGASPSPAIRAVERDSIWRPIVGTRPLDQRPLAPIHYYAAGLGEAIDVGLVPLVDVPFNRAKSAIKTLEYAAAGVLAVVSPSPEIRRVAEASDGALVAATARRRGDWLRAVESVLGLSGDERRGLAAEARTAVETGWSMEARVGEYVAAWEGR